MVTEAPVAAVTNWGSVADWVVATATFLAVVVALFKEDITQWWRRPKLVVSIALEPPHCHQTTLNCTVQRTDLTFAQAKCYYFRVWVENLGKTRATHVQVFAAKLLRRTADGSFQEDNHFLPMNLRWAHAHPRGPNGGHEVYADGISPSMGKHCDLGHIIDPANRVECNEGLPGLASTNAVFALDLEFPPNTRSHLLGPGTYQLELRIAAANAVPVTKRLEIAVTGDWFPDELRMFRDGIGMRVLSEADL